MRGTPARLSGRSTVRVRAAVVGLPIAAVLATGGCGGAPSDRPSISAAAGRAVPVMLKLDNRRLPIERYLLTDRQLDELDRARLALAGTCLARYGLALPRFSPNAGSRPAAGISSSANTAHRYGITDAVVAARFGYHMPPGTAAPAATPPEPQLSEPVRLVLTGGENGLPGRNGTSTTGTRGALTYRGQPVPEGGCLSEATRQLGAESGELWDHELVNDVNLDSFARAKNDPGTAGAIRAWSTCMRAAGISYADPIQAPGQRLGATKVATREETAVATTDVACKQRTNLVGIWFTTEQAYQEQAIREHADEFARILRELQTKTALAKLVLRGNGSTPPT